MIVKNVFAKWKERNKKALRKEIKEKLTNYTLRYKIFVNIPKMFIP